MLQKLRSRLYNEEKGFTLIELLVVILIIGILAAIALPAFLGQRAKGQDASAKSNARNMVSELESCYATEQDYQACGTQVTAANTGLPIGGADGQVQYTSNDADSFVITAQSSSTNDFTVTKTNGAPVTYNCTARGNAACPSDGQWQD